MTCPGFANFDRSGNNFRRERPRDRWKKRVRETSGRTLRCRPVCGGKQIENYTGLGFFGPCKKALVIFFDQSNGAIDDSCAI